MHEDEKVTIDWRANWLPCETYVGHVACMAADKLMTKSGSLSVYMSNYGQYGDCIPRGVLSMPLYGNTFCPSRETMMNMFARVYSRGYRGNEVPFVDGYVFDAIPAHFEYVEEEESGERGVWAIVNADKGRFYIGFSGSMKNQAYMMGVPYAVAVYLSMWYSDIFLRQSVNVLARDIIATDGGAFVFKELYRPMTNIAMDEAVDHGLDTDDAYWHFLIDRVGRESLLRVRV